MKRTLVALGGLVLVSVLTIGVALGAAGAQTQSGEGGALGNLTQANGTVSEANLSADVTVRSLGENVTRNVVQGVNASEPTVFVGPNVATGPNGSIDPNVTATNESVRINVTQEYVLGGEVSGFTGDAPASISAARNPSLNLTAGDLYAITWVNVDGREHNVVVTYRNGTIFAETNVVAETGAAQTLVFRVPEDPGTYYCIVHPIAMRGNITAAQPGATTTNASG